MPTIHLVITGKVQGVFYRATAKRMATEFGVTGWIKNTTHNSVECVATAGNESLQKFINWCSKGPLNAVVRDVIIKPVEDESFNQFSIIKG